MAKQNLHCSQIAGLLVDQRSLGPSKRVCSVILLPKSDFADPALLVLVQFALGETWGWFPRPTRHLMIVTHMSFGIILTIVVVVRVLWRFVLRHHVPSLETGFVRIASTAVHYLLYALLAAQAVLGFLSRWEGNEAMSFFGLQIPPPFTGSGQTVAHQLQDIHNWVGWAIIILAVGHALAALYHHYFLKDRVLGRMLPAAR